MRQIPLLALLFFTFFATGCDALRSLAGRPTSAEIETMREAIVRHKEVEDSLRKERLEETRVAKKEEADSIASVEGLRKVPRFDAESLGFSERPSKRFYIMVGTYAHEENANAAADLMTSKGYHAELISYRSGKKAVGVCGSNKIGRLYESYKRFSEEPFCPKGAWILVNE